MVFCLVKKSLSFLSLHIGSMLVPVTVEFFCSANSTTNAFKQAKFRRGGSRRCPEIL